MSDLSLVSTDDLLNELLSRFDHSLFAGMNELMTNPDGSGTLGVRRKWKGNSFTVCGLANQIGRIAVDDFEERAKPE